MQDRQLYEQILGIATPWFVERVELKLEQGEVHIYLAHSETTRWECPECGAACGLYDHQPERSWRHLDTCQYQTILHAGRKIDENHVTDTRKKKPFTGKAMNPKNPPLYESQATYLDRHGLLLPEEKRRLRPQDFEPEAIQVEEETQETNIPCPA